MTLAAPMDVDEVHVGSAIERLDERPQETVQRETILPAWAREHLGLPPQLLSAKDMATGAVEQLVKLVESKA
eukprot:1499691-Prymnesium_polylepis.1